MTTIILLFLGGIVLLALEVIVPGAILGIIGGILILGGVVMAFNGFGFEGGMIAAGAALVLTGIALYLEFVLLPRTRLARSLSMTGTVAGRSQPALADRSKVVGRQGIAITALTPSGYIEVDGRRYEAFARHGHTQAGERLDVVDIDNFRLIVSKPSTHVQQ